MSESFVVVFPSQFAQKHIGLLIKNIKKVLRIRKESFDFVKRDGPIIIVKANDPVFASHAIGLLFGIKRVAIAIQVKNSFSELVSEITSSASRLLLKGDRFLVTVEGKPTGFVSKDLEIAATSSIIEKCSKINARPGTEGNFDKLLYVFITKSNAYVCIFIDSGLGGLPYAAQEKSVLCCIWNELSAIAAFEAIRQGYDVKMIVCYQDSSHLLKLVKILNQIIPRIIAESVQLEFFKIPKKGVRKDSLMSLAIHVLLSVAKRQRISCVCLALSPLIHSVEMIEKIMLLAVKGGMLPIFPLGGSEEEMYKDAKELRLEKFPTSVDRSTYVENLKTDAIIKAILNSSQKITVKIGPNNIHDILDALKVNN